MCVADTSGNSEFWNLEPQLWQFRKLNETLWDKIQTTFYVENFRSLISTKCYVISTSVNLVDVSWIFEHFFRNFSKTLIFPENIFRPHKIYAVILLLATYEKLMTGDQIGRIFSCFELHFVKNDIVSNRNLTRHMFWHPGWFGQMFEKRDLQMIKYFLHQIYLLTRLFHLVLVNLFNIPIWS